MDTRFSWSGAAGRCRCLQPQRRAFLSYSDRVRVATSSEAPEFLQQRLVTLTAVAWVLARCDFWAWTLPSTHVAVFGKLAHRSRYHQGAQTALDRSESYLRLDTGSATATGC